MSHSPTWNFITAISFCTNRLGNDNLRWRTNPEVFLYKSSFLCYFIILIFHAVWDIVTSRGYTCWTEWLSSQFGGLESRIKCCDPCWCAKESQLVVICARLINWRTGHASPIIFWKQHNADDFEGVTQKIQEHLTHFIIGLQDFRFVLPKTYWVLYFLSVQFVLLSISYVTENDIWDWQKNRIISC